MTLKKEGIAIEATSAASGAVPPSAMKNILA